MFGKLDISFYVHMESPMFKGMKTIANGKEPTLMIIQ